MGERLSSRVEHVLSVFNKYGTDKGDHHSYAPIYAAIPADIKTVFEIGIDRGGSLLAWLDLFPEAHVYGLDIKQHEPLKLDRLTTICADIQKWRADGLPLLDLVIDDGSHITSDIVNGFEKLWPLCRGTYIIEDVIDGQLAPKIEQIIRDAQRGTYTLEVITTGQNNPDDRVLRVTPENLLLQHAK